MESDIYKKEYSPIEILYAACSLFQGNASMILAITLLLSVPLALLDNAASEYLAADWMSDPDLSYQEFSDKVSENLGSVLSSILAMGAIAAALSFITLLSTMALAFYIKSCIDKKKISLSQAYSKALGRWMPAMWTNVIQLILLALLFLLFVIPSLIYWVYWSFSIYAVALGGKTGKDALDHSKKTVKNRWKNVLGYSIMFILISFVLMIPPTMLIIALRTYLTNPADSFALDVTSSILSSIAGSFVAVIHIVLYINYESNPRPDKKQY